MKDYRLGLYEKSMPHRLSLREKLQAAKAAGFDFMEISIDETPQKLERLSYSKEQRQEIRRAMREVGLPIDTMCLSGHRKYPLGSLNDATREKGLDIFRQAVDFAHDIGIRLIQLAGYDVYYEEGNEKTRERFAEYLRQGTDYAAMNGVILGFETMETPFMDTVGKAMDYVNLISSPYLGVYPDLGNLTNACSLYGSDVEEELSLGAGHLFGMHIKETEEGKYRDMRFGQGRVSFAKGIRRALDIGVHLFVAECWQDCDEWQTVNREVNSFIRKRFEEAFAMPTL